jgi:nifR3 family TIM-barrel protein
LLEDPKAIGKLVRKLVDNANGVPVSVKLRLGKDKSRINVLDTAKAVDDNGASLVFVHARTRADRYDAPVDWTWLKKVKQAVKIPVVGNGSMFTPAEIKEMLETTGCDSAMIARGALGNPFIFSRFNKLMETGNDPGMPDVLIVRDTILQQINSLKNEFGDLLALDKAKKHSIWYFRFYGSINFLLDRIFSIKNLDDLRKLIDEHTENILNKNLNVDEQTEINKKFQKKVLFWLAEESAEVFG